MTWRLVLIAAVFMAISVTSASAAKKIEVVATIKPIHSLLASLMKGVGEPTLLIKDKTPYEYMPSDTDVALLKKADLVVWLGQELEGSISDKLGTSTNVFEMLGNQDIKLLPMRTDESLRDPYIWLDVRNAEVFVDALYDQLVAVDAKNEQAYRKNRALLKKEITALDRRFEFGFRAIAAGQSWLYHDTQQYFEQSYAFKVRGVLSPKPGDVADTMNLLTTRDAFSKLDGTCMFVEEGLTQERLSLATDGTKARIETLDSFGLKLKAGPDLYIQMMKNHFDTIANCFTEIGAKYTGPTTPAKVK